MTRRALTWAVVALAGLFCVTGSCGRTKRSRKPAPPDGAVVVHTPDAAVRPPPRRPQALRGLLAHVPRRATWFVGVGRPATLLQGTVRFWTLLVQIPDLAAPMSLMARRLAKALGGWPPPATLWSDLGIDPGGGIVVAGVGAGPKRSEGILALVYTQTPGRVLKRLVGPAGVAVAPGAMAKAVLEGVGSWWCGRVSVGVSCASSRALLTESQSQAAAAPAPTLLAQLSVKRWSGVDLVGGWRAQTGEPITTAVVRFTPWGLMAEVRFRRGELSRWLGWLGPGKKLQPFGDALGAVWLNLDAARISTLVGLVPASAMQTTAPGAPAPAEMLRQCTGEVMLTLGAGAWRLRAARRASTVGPGRPVRWTVSGWPVWARASAASLFVAGTAAGTRPLAAGTGAVPPTRAMQGLLMRPVAAAMRVPLMDPLEMVSEADRVRLVAAIAGLPAGERALVGLLRGLFSLFGEAGVSLERTADGALARASLVTPAAGSPLVRREFERLWRAKWLGGGFFERQDLARVASRLRSKPQAKPLLRLARAVTGLQLGPPWSSWLTDALLGLLRRLSGPELSCAALAARLVRCREPFSRVRSPQRWSELERVGLPAHRRELRRALLDETRREQAALGAHCDRLSGRLENVREISACLEADSCTNFARCLVRAFTPRK